MGASCMIEEPTRSAVTRRGLIAAALLALATPIASRPANAQGAERSGKEVVQAVCAACHATGANGAPKIGDREAWIPRMKQGLDTLVRSAIRGHGGMPPRGGQANLTDSEIQAAVLYMFNPAVKPAASAAKGAGSPPRADPNHKTAGGV